MQSFFTIPDDEFLNYLESVLPSEAFKRIELWQGAAKGYAKALSQLTASIADLQDAPLSKELRQ